jgi:putative membrane protein
LARSDRRRPIERRQQRSQGNPTNRTSGIIHVLEFAIGRVPRVAPAASVLRAGRVMSFVACVNPPPDDAAIFAIERPHPSLFTYYWLALLLFPPVLPILILPAWFRYHTMRYKFTDEGISMRWGILFRREVIVNYARIQDIHLRSNIVERWFGLGRVLVQTASGNAGAEMTLEGLKEFEAVRDFLYARMRGVKEPAPHHGAASSITASAEDQDLAAALRNVAQELRAVRLTLEARRGTTHSSRDV